MGGCSGWGWRELLMVSVWQYLTATKTSGCEHQRDARMTMGGRNRRKGGRWAATRV